MIQKQEKSKLLELFSKMTFQNTILYHGTARDSIKEILENGFVPSTGKKNYLGDGVYFYDSEIFAIWWRFKNERASKKATENLLKKNKLREEELEELILRFNEKNGIIASKFESITCLDMDNFKNKEIFNQIYQFIYGNEPSEEIFETTIYNIMFEELDLKNKFDMIVLTTNFHKLPANPNYKNKAPQANIPYRIYCVKKSDKITNMFESLVNKEQMDTYLNFMILKN